MVRTLQTKKPDISIIIVHYKVLKELFACIESILSNKPKVSFEIIVVDNDEKKTIQAKLNKKFPKVKYVNNPINNGWGGGVNLGNTYATGEYLYLLNPDTIVFPDTFDRVYEFAQKNKNIGIASSVILDSQKNPYLLQGNVSLTPLNAIVVHSFLNKYFPHNSISKNFWRFDPTRDSPQEVPIATLTGAIIRKDIFEKAGKFDESFFLYFEEFDLGKRINQLGLHNYIVPQSKIVHLWGVSSKTRNDINEIFRQSRFNYLKKYYGIIAAIFVDRFLRLNKESFMRKESNNRKKKL